MLASTSGTTGQPKVAMHFHRDVLATADTFSKYLIKPHRDDVFTGTPPLGFTYGLGGLLLFPLRAGASTLLIERATPAELADAIAAHGVTVLSTAPTAYRAMLAAGKAPALKNLRRCVSAGEHLPKSVWEDFRQATGLAIIDGIGSTEMLHIFIAAADGDIRPGSTGTAVPGYRATILDEHGAGGARRRARAARRPGPDRLPLPVRRAPAEPTCSTAGTSPATPTSATPTATSGTRRAATT